MSEHKLNCLMYNYCMAETNEQVAPRIRTFIPVGDNTLESFRGERPRSFVKVSGPDVRGYEDPVTQYNSYQQLREYLHMPRVRLLYRQEGLPPLLVVKRVEGERYDEAFIESPDAFTASARMFVDDLNKMWQATEKPMKEDELVVNLRQATIETLQAVLGDEKLAQSADLPIRVNGATYPSLRDLCSASLKRLRTQADPVMTLGHGDEHMKNLIITNNNGQIDYQIIDSRLAGNYSPAYAINTFVGTPLLFMFNYQCSQKIGTRWDISYRLNDEYQKPREALMECGRTMINNLGLLSQDEFLLKEYLFGNLVRSAINRVNPKNMRFTQPNIPAHIGMAVELYSNFDKFMSPSLREAVAA